MSTGSRIAKCAWVCLLMALSAILISAGRAQGQAQTATISGTATDASGGALAGAKIQATSVETNISQSTTTDPAGRYTIPQLAVGTYTLQASLSGFKTVVHTGIVLSVGGVVVLDFSLPVGEVTQTVSVESEVSRVETESSEVSTLVSPAQMRELPLNGRNFEQLLTLAPGVATLAPAFNAVTGRMYGMMDNYSIAGSRPTGQMFLLDNTDIRDFWEHGTGSGYAGTSLGVEAIGEFQLLTNSYTAQFAGNGAVMNATSRSGSNDLHGGAYEFIRNSVVDALDAPDKIAKASNPGLTEPPPFKRNQFGGDLGGPIKKDKVFFFANYEGLREGLEQTAFLFLPESYTVQGKMPCYSPVTGGTLNINPFACPAPPPANGPYPAVGSVGNPVVPIIIPAVPGPVAEEAAAVYGLCHDCKRVASIQNVGPFGSPTFTPTLFPSGTDLGGYAAYASFPNLVTNEDYVLGRVDYTLGANDSLFGRFVFDDARVQDNPRDPTGIFPEQDFTRNQFLTIGEKHIVSATMVNSVHIGFVRTNENSRVQGSLTPAQISEANTISTGLGGPAITTDPLRFVTVNNDPLPREDGQISFFDGMAILGPDQNRPLTLIDNKFSGGDDLAWSHGAHSLKVGAVVTRVQINTFQTAYANGGLFFPLPGALPAESFSLAGDYYFAFDVTAGENNATRYLREIDVAPYIQDDWKVTPSLTLNIGFRYDYATNPIGWSGFNQPLTTIIGSYLPPIGPIANTISPYAPFTPVKHVFADNINAANFGPRFGFAWDIFKDHKTSLRGGTGIFYDPTAPRLYQSNFINSAPAGFSFVVGPGFPDPCAANVCAPGATGEFAGVDYLAPRGSPYQLQYNLDLQRELWHGTVLSVGYIGSVSRHLWTQGDINPPQCIPSPGSPGFPDCSALPQIPTSLPTVTGGAFTVQTQNGNTADPTSCVVASEATCYGSGVRFPFVVVAPGVLNLEIVPNHINNAFGAVVQAHNTASSGYNSLQVSLNHQFARNFTGQVNYTYSRCVDDGSFASSLEEWAQLNTDTYNEKYDYENCNFDIRHNFSANGLYTLPFKGNRFVEGWQFSTVLGIHTGLPVNIYNSGTYDPADLGSQWNSRPNYSFAPGCHPNHILDQKIGVGTIQWFDPSCYEAQAPGFLGNVKRNSVPGPGTVGADISVTKNTKLTEKLNMQLRFEAFNFINHFNPGASSPFSGLVLGAINLATNTSGQTQYSQAPAVNPRQLQAAVKFDF